MKLGDKSYWCYMTKLFLLLAEPNESETEEDVDFILSFNINNHDIRSISWYSHLLTLRLDTDLVIHEVNFIDSKTKALYFGDEAYENFEKHIHEQKGFCKCPLCDRYIPLEIMITDKGYCKICETEIPNITFN